MKKIALTTIIFIFAALIRFVGLANVPPALNSDEVAIGYNAYSILKTGKDEYGYHMPLTFRSFDDYKMPVYVYMVSGSMALFGKSDFALRFPSAFFGTLTVLLTYFLVVELFGYGLPNFAKASSGKRVTGYGLQGSASQSNNSSHVTRHTQTIALLAMLLLAISPWHIFFSRSGYEANVSVFFVVLGLYMFFRGLRKGMFLVGGAISFSLALWTYHTCRVFVPLLLIGLLILYSKDIWQKKWFAFFSIIVGVLILFPILQITMSPEGQMRAIGVSAYENSEILKKSVGWIQLDKEKGMDIFSFFHNRRVEYSMTFLRRYFSYFDFNFLFLDKSIDKYRAPGIGLMYVIEIPFFLFGLYRLVRVRIKGTLLLLYWLAIAPVAASFTLQFSHPVRTIVFLPALQIITALGLLGIVKSIKHQKLIIVFLSMFFIVNGTYFLHQYFVHMPVDDAKDWYVGRKEITQLLKKYENQYEKILISNTLDFPYIFFLYYYPVDPSAYLNAGGTRSGGYREDGNKFDKFEFKTIREEDQTPGDKTLFVVDPHDSYNKQENQETIYYPNGTPAIVVFGHPSIN